MAYRLKSGESVAEGVRRLIGEQIDRADATLRSEDREEGVHEARKAFKRSRAALRLARGALGEEYAIENRRFRDAGRALSGVRDATALLEAFRALKQAFTGQLAGDGFARFEDILVARRNARLHDNAEATEQAVAEVRGGLDAARERAGALSLSADEFAALRPGFERTYQRGRAAAALAYRSPTPAHFHDWRKRVKYHRYHVALLRPVWPPVIKGHRTSLKHLSDLLGDDHDLVVVAATLIEHEAEVSGDELKTLLAVVRQRQAELRTEAKTLSQRIYAEKPSRIGARVETYWNAWRAWERRPLHERAGLTKTAAEPPVYAGS